MECAAFWTGAAIQEQLIGRGDSPTAAYDDLIDKACARVGIDRPTAGTHTDEQPWDDPNAGE